MTAITAMLLTVAGCASAGGIRVLQPDVASAEADMMLGVSRAVFDSDGRTLSLLIESPLPGAITGVHYRTYIRAADGSATQLVGEPLASGGFTAGFFAQVLGRRQGFTELASGQLTLGGSGLGDGARRTVDLMLTCGDGTELQGRLEARCDRRALLEFEQRSPEARAILRLASLDAAAPRDADTPPTAASSAPAHGSAAPAAPR